MNFKDCLLKLEKAGQLTHVKSEVDLVHEMAGIAAKFEGKNVLIFEKLKGHTIPVAIGLWWNRKNLSTIFGCETEKLSFLFADAVKSLMNDPVAPVITKDVPAQEIIMETPDLTKIPVPTFALKDGGPYFTNCIVIAKDPDTGVRNTSIHRLMVTGKQRLGLLMDMGRHLRDYYERAEAKGQPLEITINNGVHPAYYVAATTPGVAAPIDVDELCVASYLLGEPAKLCKGNTVDVEGIADAQMIMEAEIFPHVREPEGPFGEVSGYYASRDNRWVVNIRQISMQKNPVIHMLHPGKEVWNSVGLGVEANLFQTLNKQIKGLKKVYLSHGGSHYHAIIQMDPPRNGMSKNEIAADYAENSDLQMVAVVNSDVNIYDAADVERAMVTRCDPGKDIVIIPDALGHELNPITNFGQASKMGFDCTYPVPKEAKFEKVAFMNVNLQKYELE